MRKLKKFVTIVLAAVITLTLAACGAPFAYDKDAAVKSAEEITDLANKRDYQGICDKLPDSLKSQMSADDLKKAWDGALNDSGSFKEYGDVETAGVKQKGVNYIVVTVQAKYEKATRIFTISYTTDMQPAGLWMK